MTKEHYMDLKFYNKIQTLMNTAKQMVYQTANFIMVKTYWQIRKMIVEKQGGEERAEYGKDLIKELSKQMTKDYGKGYTVSNLKYMKQFYLTFQNSHALRGQLNWTHYRLLLKVKNDKAREFYMNECIQVNQSTRQLDRQIQSQYYEQMLLSHDKEKLSQQTNTLEEPMKPSDIVKDTYVLEFFQPNDSFYESDLEQALIDHLQAFLLELGNGFSFVAR